MQGAIGSSPFKLEIVEWLTLMERATSLGPEPAAALIEVKSGWGWGWGWGWSMHTNPDILAGSVLRAWMLERLANGYTLADIARSRGTEDPGKSRGPDFVYFAPP
jgi:hypothetical protein